MIFRTIVAYNNYKRFYTKTKTAKVNKKQKAYHNTLSCLQKLLHAKVVLFIAILDVQKEQKELKKKRKKLREKRTNPKRKTEETNISVKNNNNLMMHYPANFMCCQYDGMI